MVKVKICGITNGEDALFAQQAGADFLGFIVNIPSSKDNLRVSQAQKLIAQLPLEAIPVMVTYHQKAKPIIIEAKQLKPEVIQLHDAIPPKEIQKIRKALKKIKLTKAIHVTDESSLQEAKKYEKYVDYLLLDTKTLNKIGGTGKTHDWGISRKIVKAVKKKVFLAGGINPVNVREAIMTVKPYAIDLNSGVKAAPRKKDAKKIRALFAAVK